jgi:hypothetical protein
MICVFISDSNISLRSNVGSKTQGIIETSIKEFHMDIPTSLQSGKYDDQRVTSQIIIILLSSLILFFRYVSIGIWRSYVSRNGPCATNISNQFHQRLKAGMAGRMLCDIVDFEWEGCLFMYESPAYEIGSRVDICCVMYPMLLSHQSAVDKESDRESQLSSLDIDSWGRRRICLFTLGSILV